MTQAKTAIALIAGVVIGGAVVAGTGLGSGGLSKPEVETVIKDYISANPTLIVESLQKWQQEQQKARMSGAAEALKDPALKEAIYNNPNSPSIGPVDAKAVIVEFFDYNCPACKSAFKALDELQTKDKNVKIIFKEFPIFGPQSDTNSKIGIAVFKLAPEKYFDFHSKMMTFEGRADEAQALKFVKEIGLDADKVKSEIAKPEYTEILGQLRQIGMKLGIQGTPSFIIGEELVPHALDYQGLEEKVSKLR
jgi:protein-disulfide isomerase